YGDLGLIRLVVIVAVVFFVAVYKGFHTADPGVHAGGKPAMAFGLWLFEDIAVRFVPDHGGGDKDRHGYGGEGYDEQQEVWAFPADKEQHEAGRSGEQTCTEVGGRNQQADDGD